jgi:hypothetical protein
VAGRESLGRGKSRGQRRKKESRKKKNEEKEVF